METQAKDNNLFIILIATVAALGGFLFGFDSGVINGTVKGLEAAFDAKDVNVASMVLGCAVGAFFAGNLAYKYGRRSMLMISAVFFIISA